MGKYVVSKTFGHKGKKRNPGDRLELTDRQALYLVLSGKIKKEPPAGRPPAVKTGRPVSAGAGKTSATKGDPGAADKKEA